MSRVLTPDGRAKTTGICLLSLTVSPNQRALRSVADRTPPTLLWQGEVVGSSPTGLAYVITFLPGRGPKAGATWSLLSQRFGHRPYPQSLVGLATTLLAVRTAPLWSVARDAPVSPATPAHARPPPQPDRHPIGF